MLDQELERLPPKYRTVLILCDLEGKTARKWPTNSVGQKAPSPAAWHGPDELLAKRLTRYGLVLSGASVAATLSGGAASACVPPSLPAATVQAALVFAAGQAVTAGLISGEVMALAEGVLKTMLLSKLKLVTVLAIAAVIVTGVGVTVRTLPALVAGQAPALPAVQKGGKPAADAVTVDSVEKDQQKLRGRWNVVSLASGGKIERGVAVAEFMLTFEKNTLTTNLTALAGAPNLTYQPIPPAGPRLSTSSARTDASSARPSTRWKGYPANCLYPQGGWFFSAIGIPRTLRPTNKALPACCFSSVSGPRRCCRAGVGMISERWCVAPW